MPMSGPCPPTSATSTPPARAGVQLPVIDVLLEHGAQMNLLSIGGNNHGLLFSCLANGQPEAAAYLLERGAPADFTTAAGLGRIDLMRQLIDEKADLAQAFYYASGYGRVEAVQFLLDRGLPVDVEVDRRGSGQTALHFASYRGHADVVQLLLRHGASVHTIDNTWHTPPLIWALTGYEKRGAKAARYYDVVAQLVAAGATVTPDLLTWEKAQADPQLLAALTRPA